MKKHLLASICCILIGSLYAQTTHLTRAQVYDFNVGDVFERQTWEHYPGINGGSNTPIYTWVDSVISRTNFSIGDSVTYELYRVTHQPGANPNLPATTTTGTITTTYLNLSANIDMSNTAPTNCYVVVDTIYNSQCSKLIEQTFPKPITDSMGVSSFCFEPPSRKASYIEGGGLYFLEDVHAGFQNSTNERLIYFKKGNLTCGSFVAFPTSIKDISIKNNIKISPTIVENSFTINVLKKDVYTMAITDISGKTILRNRLSETNEIDISQLNKGLYFIKIISSKNETYTEKIIKL